MIGEEDRDLPYQPKESMCASCERRLADCSDLYFDIMPVINRGKNVVIVRCTEWKKRK